MAFASMQFRANAIEKQSSLYAIIPESPGPWPVLYLLHGLTDDHTTWHRRTRIEAYVEGMNLLVVMPDGHRSFYVNDPRPGGLAYENHIVRDVVGFVETTFHTVRGRGGRAIAGLSMGGYGAVMLALKHAELFSVACSHSGALGFADPRSDPGEARRGLVEAIRTDRHDCHALARKVAASKQAPAMRIDCGVDDLLIEHNRAFHATCEEVGLPHEYAEYPGEHNWDYWDKHIRDSLRFIAAHLPALRT